MARPAAAKSLACSPYRIARRSAALPCNARAYTPWVIAAMRKYANARKNGQSAMRSRPEKRQYMSMNSCSLGMPSAAMSMPAKPPVPSCSTECGSTCTRTPGRSTDGRESQVPNRARRRCAARYGEEWCYRCGSRHERSRSHRSPADARQPRDQRVHVGVFFRLRRQVLLGPAVELARDVAFRLAEIGQPAGFVIDCMQLGCDTRVVGVNRTTVGRARDSAASRR